MSTPMTRTVSPFLLLLALALPAAAEDIAPAPAPTPAPPAEVTVDGRFTMEFRGARLGQVLDYLSKQAGYVIANPVELAQPITLVALTPLTPVEAVDALNSVLIGLGHAAIVRGHTLHIVPLPSARQQNLPVEVGADPKRIPETDRMVTQIIPVSFATAKDLAENLTPLLNTTTATLAANESSNTLILTDTQANIRRIAAIVQAIDSSVSGEQQVRVFNLSYADATTVAQVITDLYTSKTSASRNNQNQGGAFAQMFGGRNSQQQSQPAQTASGSASAKAGEVSAAADSGTNSVVVRASAPTMTVLAEVVAKLDVDTSTRDGVLVYRVRNSKAASLAESLTSLFSSASSSGSNNARTTTQNRTVPGSSQGSNASSSTSSLDLSGQVKVVAEANSNSVLVLTAERNHERIRKILEDLDQPVRQVLVRVLIAEVTIEKGLDVGIELQGANPSGSDTLSRVFSSFDIFDSTLGMNGYLLESTDFRAAIRALASDTRFDVLSRPYILTTDNQLATVNVSQNVPVINGSRTDANNNVTTTFDRQDVGIILTVTPQINSDGRVVLDVNQVMSALADATIPIAADVTAPIINQRTMTTRVVVEHGQTAVVGGLVKDSLTETVRKVPLLGDIPLLGWLFKRTVRTKSQTELLVFLTPQVVGTPAELADLSRQLRSEMQHLDAAVEAGLLQRHLDQLAGLPIGEPIMAPAEPVKE
jgi:general secretion pathway protein D